MTIEFTTDNIDQLVALPLATGTGWEVTFRSGNANLCHQLYANGCLADWTEDISQRRFVLDDDLWPRQVAIVAVEADAREMDLSDSLAGLVGEVTWVHRIRLVRGLDQPAGTRLEVRDDHATGQMSPLPVAVAEFWPPWMPRQAPGFGQGAFGEGPFAQDADILELPVPLPEAGTHQLVLRNVLPDGQCGQTNAILVNSTPPPPPAGGLAFVAYDTQNSIITLQVQ